jgi:16S rRNA (cytidine1402-2'-O)-methyltransferase
MRVATLFIVATPIGNLGDITLRALEILKSVDIIACEDTRRTLQLLNHFGIKARLLSCRARNELLASRKIMEVLDGGGNAAYASDAGTPGLSDPGSVLVRATREAGHIVVPIPGTSAFAALVSIAGGLDKSVLFEGFLSPKPGRRRARLAELLETREGFILYESPFRIVKLMQDLADLDGERYACLGREMTKLHEEYISGSILEILGQLSGREKQLGEFSLFVSGKKSGKLLE